MILMNHGLLLMYITLLLNTKQTKTWLNTIEFLLAKLRDGINIEWDKAMLLRHLLY